MVTSMLVACPAMASSMELSTTSQTRWCRPRASVEPMYMPGRRRTASRPSRTWMESAVYAGGLAAPDRRPPLAPRRGRASVALACSVIARRSRHRSGRQSIDEPAKVIVVVPGDGDAAALAARRDASPWSPARRACRASMCWTSGSRRARGGDRQAEHHLERRPRGPLSVAPTASVPRPSPAGPPG